MELTPEMAQKINQAAQVMSGLTRAASQDCGWVRTNTDLHAEILELQNDLRDYAASVLGSSDMSAHLMKAHTVGNQLRELFQPLTSPDPTTSTENRREGLEPYAESCLPDKAVPITTLEPALVGSPSATKDGPVIPAATPSP
jgi:hypothetical protein